MALLEVMSMDLVLLRDDSLVDFEDRTGQLLINTLRKGEH